MGGRGLVGLYVGGEGGLRCCFQWAMRVSMWGCTCLSPATVTKEMPSLSCDTNLTEKSIPILPDFCQVSVGSRLVIGPNWLGL